MVSSPPRIHLDVLLMLVAAKLELTPTQYTDANEKYEAVHDWLSVPESLLASAHPELYPQGSLRLLTTVKPRSYEEYDLDIVCQFRLDSNQITPAQLYRLVQTRLSEHPYYKSILEPKNRCLRLDYKGQFHMDILPACPDSSLGGTAILVPDRKEAGWKASDPQGYAAWFDSMTMWTTVENAMEPLPLPVAAPKKSPLQRAVQLIKRRRDQGIEDPDIAPASIVLTTLAAEAYNSAASPAAAVSGYLHYVTRLIASSDSRPFQVFNPTNPKELLSERWESVSGAYDAFRQETCTFEALWQRLLHAQGLPQITPLMKELFGENVATAAVDDYSKALARSRQDGTIGTKTGSSALALGTGSLIKKSPPNTFHGSAEV